jgi:hypothetical protein
MTKQTRSGFRKDPTKQKNKDYVTITGTVSKEIYNLLRTESMIANMSISGLIGDRIIPDRYKHVIWLSPKKNPNRNKHA